MKNNLCGSNTGFSVGNTSHFSIPCYRRYGESTALAFYGYQTFGKQLEFRRSAQSWQHRTIQSPIQGALLSKTIFIIKTALR